MTGKYVRIAAACVVAGAAIMAVAARAQTQTQTQAPAPRFTPPRTPWGDPDLQGIWPGTESLGIPLQRDPALGTRAFLTEAEFQDRQKNAQRQVDAMNEEFDLETADTANAGAVGSATSPPPHWQERGKPSHQASLIVEPADGRMPPLTAEAQARQAADAAARRGRGPADSYLDRSLYDRCLTRGVTGSILPVIYNNGNEIVQAPGYVVIRNEMIHESRIVPLDGRPRVSPAIRQWMGDSRGHWEGDTLVVETRNLTNRTGINQGNNPRHSEAMTLVERFTLSGPDTLQYRVTVNDPQTWTRPWTIEFPWTRDSNYLLFEYSCHEGNYAMRNLLSGARADEKSAALPRQPGR